MNQLEWGVKYDGVDNAPAEQKFYVLGSSFYSLFNSQFGRKGQFKKNRKKDKDQNKEIKQQQHIRKKQN